MSSEVRSEALTLLGEVWEMSPDVRLGQLMAHLGFLGENHFGHGLGSIDDDELMAMLQRHKAELEARSHSAPLQAVSQTNTEVSG
jgi:hypothetical protein